MRATTSLPCSTTYGSVPNENVCPIEAANAKRPSTILVLRSNAATSLVAPLTVKRSRSGAPVGLPQVDGTELSPPSGVTMVPVSGTADASNEPASVALKTSSSPQPAAVAQSPASDAPKTRASANLL